MPRQLILTDQGTIEFKELRTNGLDGITVRAPASLVAAYSLTLPTALPAGTEYVQLSATGQLATVAGSPTTLDGAYDSGGPGAGRIITADTGPVEAAGAGGFLASHSAPVYGLETTGAEYNFRLVAGLTANILEIQRGDQDGDISDDVFEPVFALDGVNRRLGINTVAPATLAHLLSPSGDAKLTIQAPAASDASVIFNEDSTARWEVGYDDSAGGLVVGRLSFTNPAVFVEDTTGDVGVNELVPDAKFHVTSGSALALLIEATVGSARLGLRDSASTNENQVGILAVGNALRLRAGGAEHVAIDSAGQVGIGLLTPLAKLHIQNDIAATRALRIEQNSNAPNIRIDSSATSAPVIDIVAVATNTHGDILFSSRTADPNASEGEIWYNTTANLLRYSSGTASTILNLGTNTFQTVADPGDAGTITPPATSNFRCDFTNSTGAQTRVLADPAFIGQRGILTALFTGGGTTTTITESTGWLGGGTADDVATFNTSGEIMEVLAVSLTEWRASSSFGVAFS